jgi:two-component system sensor histidine kinase/response regulator
VRVCQEVEETENSGIQSFLRIDVEDTGVGIKDQDKSKLFKLFGFLDETKVINTSGIGLGLVISEKLVTLLGGKISFTSEFGKGSVFTFTLFFRRTVVN